MSSSTGWLVPGLEHIVPNVPKADLAKLRTRTARIARFATNELAHYTESKGTFAGGLTLGDLHGAINLVVDLSVKYRLLIMGAHMAKTVAMDSWLHVFVQPWIADGDRLMEIHRRMEALWAKRADGEPLTDADYFL
jgi:hypothetical protein